MGNTEVDNEWYEKRKNELADKKKMHQKQLENKRSYISECQDKRNALDPEDKFEYVDDDVNNIKIPAYVEVQSLEAEIKRAATGIEDIEKDIKKDDILNARLDRLMEAIKTNKDYDELKSLTQYSLKKVSDKDVADMLDRDSDAKKIALRLQKKDVRRVGVFGRWGSGKSTFLNLIKKEIEAVDEKKSFHMIDIDASEYSDQAQIWANIYERIKDEYKKEDEYGIKLAQERFNAHKGRNLINAFVFIALVAVMAVCSYFEQTKFTNMESALPKWLCGSFTYIALIVFICKYVLPLSYKAVPEVRKVMDALGKVFELPTMKETLKEKETVKKNLELLFSAWGKKDIVLFVDELDRSNTKTIQSFFQAVQLFDKMENIRIVYAVDQEILRDALSNEDDDGQFITTEKVFDFTEKYVDVSIFLDGQVGLKEFVKKLIAENKLLSSEERDSFDKAIAHCSNLNARICIKLYNIISQSKDDWIKSFDTFKDDIETYFEFKDYIYWATLRVMREKLDDIRAVALSNVDKYESVKILRDIYQQNGAYYDNGIMESGEGLVLTDSYEMNDLIIHDISLFEQMLEKYFAL